MKRSMPKAGHVKPQANIHTIVIVAVVVATAVVGISLLVTSRAATNSVAREAESATPQGNARVIDQAGASGGKAVHFGSDTTIPPGSGCDQASIQRLVDSVSAQKVEANLRELVQDDSKPTPNELISRHVSSAGNQIKVDWAKQQMAGYGLQVVDQPFSSGGRTLNNVSARLNGTDQNSLYVVGAHIDAISESPKTLAPGADDDGSGVVAVMEAARVLKGFEKCLKSTLYFNNYNDEEEDAQGSPTFLKSISGKTVKGAYNLDMVAYQPSQECLKSDVGKSSRDQFLAQKIVDMNQKYAVGLPVTTGTYTQNGGDDLEPFWKANMPGGYLIECTTEKDTDGYPDYHSTKDMVKNVNLGQVTKVAKLLVAALAEFGTQ